jgi:flavin reductase (DIM6/NTAB) family NADH-FMN oxidoreductase RutF
MQKPWNRINVPVYSLASYDGDQWNMNICTYVTPVSMKPKIYAVGVYRDTKTLEVVEKTDTCVLQLLSPKQLDLVNLLGKKSGHSTNKMKVLAKRDEVEQWHGYTVLKDTAARLLVRKQDAKQTGDHLVVFFAVEKHQSLPHSILTLDHLRKAGLIAI